MKKDFVLERNELTLGFVNMIVINMLFTYPRMMINNSGNAAWIQMIYVSLVSFLIFLLVDFLLAKNATENIFELSEKIGGKFMKKSVGAAVILIIILKLASNMRIFPETVRTVLLPETPTELILLLFVFAISVGAYMGIYSIFRIHSLFIPIAGIVMLIFFIILIPDINWNNIFPIAGLGTQKIFINGLSSVSLFSDIMLIYIILPFCKNKRDTKHSMTRAILFGSGAAVLIILLYCLVYPYPISGEFVLPVYQLARIANIGQYFQRFDAFFEFSWSIAMMLCSALYLYMICFVFAEVFELKYHRELIIPIAVISAGIGFIPTNFVTFISDSYYILNITSSLLYVICAFVGIAYRIKERKCR